MAEIQNTCTQNITRNEYKPMMALKSYCLYFPIDVNAIIILNFVFYE